MPTVATQTSWSWVRDLARLATSYGENDPHFSALLSLSPTARNEDWPSSTHSAESTLTLPPILTQKDSNHMTRKPRTVTFLSLLPDEVHINASPEADPRPISAGNNSNGVTNDDNFNSDAISHDVILPSVPENENESSGDSSSCDVVPNREETGDTSVSILDKLEQMDYSEQEESVESDDAATSSESDNENEERSDDDDETPKSKPKIPDLGPVRQLPWPTILQYVKESESQINQYFSLDNKEAVDARTEEAKEMLHETSNEDTDAPLDWKPLEGHEGVNEGSEVDEAERDGSLFCHFCGRRLPRSSLLADSQDIESMKEQDYFCCTEYKEYKVLVAVCMRQMVEKMRTAPPQKIVLKAPADKNAQKKELQVKALLILRRKQRREEIRRKKEQEREARKHTRGMKILRFTMDSPDALQKGWALKKKTPNKIRNCLGNKVTAAVRRQSKPTSKEKVEPFPAETLKRLKAQVVSRALERRFFSSGRTYLTILPDRTGYCNYPSGHKAVVFFSLYEGALAYMVFEDSDHPRLLACADELGRSCCYHPDGKVRFLCTPRFMAQFDSSSQTRRKVRSSGVDTSLFQPILVPLNKHITFKCNQESASLTVSFPPEHFKFSICSKLHKDEELRYSSQLQSTVGAAESALASSKVKIGQLLYMLQNISQIQKLSKLEALYGTPGAQSSHPSKIERGSARRRTRSTGAVKLGKCSNERSGGKHMKALTSDLA